MKKTSKKLSISRESACVIACRVRSSLFDEPVDVYVKYRGRITHEIRESLEAEIDYFDRDCNENRDCTATDFREWYADCLMNNFYKLCRGFYRVFYTETIATKVATRFNPQTGTNDYKTVRTEPRSTFRWEHA